MCNILTHSDLPHTPNLIGKCVALFFRLPAEKSLKEVVVGVGQRDVYFGVFWLVASAVTEDEAEHLVPIV